MRLMQLRLPIRAAVRPTATFVAATTLTTAPTIPPHGILAAKCTVEGHRYASVKAQGAYKLKNKKTLPKKMGAKRVGDQYVLPGTIIYKQRGTLWFPGENTILGRDHTIHAAVAGYVKYYRDPQRHPDRKYIGITFERNDVLPYSPSAPRKRRLGLVAIPRKAAPAFEPLTRSGIPRRVIRRAGVVELGEAQTMEPTKGETAAAEAAEAVKAAEAAAAATAATAAATTAASNTAVPQKKETKATRAARRWNAYIRIKRTNRVLYVDKNYAYRESNFMIGRLMGKNSATRRYGSRSAVLRHRRAKRDEQLRLRKELMAQQRMLSSDKSAKNTGGGKKKAAAAKKKSGPKKRSA
ncbi:hypothetical protein SEPCBS119000_006287 [Sporothrix epigloea]|uniref:Large ribosomal subunit protein bL27m n=1 Tax=Sporothrix epigloea TaxID=1892477 RepID=A0ABP0E461_9PEZI